MQDTDSIQPASLATTFFDMIADPGRAFRRLTTFQQRSWWLPALLAVLAPILYLWLNLNRTVEQATRQLEMQLSTLPPDQIEAARAMATRFTQPNAVLITGVISSVLALAVGLLISTFILYFGAALFGAIPKLQQLWPAVAWTWLPFALRGFLQSVWSGINQSLIHYPGLSYWVATGDLAADSQQPAFVALAQLDLFALWHAVLVYVLLRVVARLGAGGALVLTLLYAAINIGIRVLPAFVGGLFSIGG